MVNIHTLQNTNPNSQSDDTIISKKGYRLGSAREQKLEALSQSIESISELL